MSGFSNPLSVHEILAHQEFLRSLARGLVADASGADDLVQETYLHVLSRSTARPQRLRAWLARLVTNLARDRRRSEVRRATREQGYVTASAGTSAGVRAGAGAGGAAANTDALVQRMELHQRLVQLVLALPPRSRDLVLLHHFEGRTVAEAAEHLGIPVETARTRLRRALHELRAQVDAELGGRDAALAALLPLARLVPGTAAAAPAAPLVAATSAGGALVGVPLVMTGSTKFLLAVASLVVVGGLLSWVVADDAVAPPVRTEVNARDELASRATGERRPAEDGATDAPMDRVAIDAEPPAPADRIAPTQPELGVLRLETVWARDETPAAGTHVRLSFSSQPGRDEILPLRRAQTDEQGELVLRDVVPGTIELSAAGFNRADLDEHGCAHTVEVRAGLVTDFTLRLPDVLGLSGDVVDGADRPIAGASVWIGDQKEALCDGVVVAVTGADGKFEVRSVGNFHFASAYAPGHAMADAIAVTRTFNGESTKRIRFVLEPIGAGIRGRVSGSGGRPLAGILVVADLDEGASRLLADGSIGDRPPARFTRTDAEGRFEIDSVRAGEITLLAHADGLAPASAKLTLTAGTVTEHDFALTGGGRIEGVVRDGSGVALEGVKIEVLGGFGSRLSVLFSSHTVSAADGRFALERLAPGLLLLVATHGASGSGAGSLRKPVTVTEGEATPCDLVLSHGLTLRGRVIDARGQPIAGCGIRLEPREPSPTTIPGQVETDAEGRFAIPECADIDYTAQLFHPAQTWFAALEKGPVHPASEEITIVLADENLPTASIRGRLLHPDGGAAAGAMVSIFRENGNTIASLQAQEDGSFQWGALTPGRYSLWAAAEPWPQLSLGRHDLAAAAKLDLGERRFDRPASLTVRAERSDGIAVTPADLVLRGAGGGQVDLVRADRELRATMLVPGEYVLVVVGSGLAARETPVSIKAGSHMTVSVHLEPGIPRTLRFEKQGGGALAGPVTWTASDASGAELHGTLQIEPGAASAELTLSLAIGEWSLEASGADGARAETLFAVSRRQPEADPVVVALGR